MAQGVEMGLYHLKKITFHGAEVPIILQNENGPCPLIAISNILLLTKKIYVHPDYSMVTFEQLISLIGDYLMSMDRKNIAVDLRANYEHNVADALATMPKMAVGLDVNVRFSEVHKFEFTSECLVFDVLDIRLVHGWIIDPQEDAAKIILHGDLSYNQLVDRLIEFHSALAGVQDETAKPADKERILREGALIESFLNTSASQLTYMGLLKLHHDLRNGDFCVFFRNNHFSTLLKQDDELYLLATDLGYLREPNLVWEKLSEIDGDSIFVNSKFAPYIPSKPSESDNPEGAPKPADGSAGAPSGSGLSRQEQEEQDFLLAIQLSSMESPNTSSTNVPSGGAPNPVVLHELADEPPPPRTPESAGSDFGLPNYLAPPKS
mmetsp:Transcript_4420/g.12388  ORF Transcript_4420/g.12388 Transcript_4420/m.12388 type:complete len:378 (+) Transcript_4420:142-1275(+)|eukprot:CAMPEP_0119128576 /NCGR_PEP_ID=MMETSP1310-20130426/6674_1 /TAXON_ID=464262 /ORGANISM="Genus nov. species nov., Strain RCC2339" /LENGTH=377 /DNA_ID=CAMNT_0007118925 /DNA_START=88 /DNA_END=1221 /DNA_ORIENTATION=+